MNFLKNQTVTERLIFIGAILGMLGCLVVLEFGDLLVAGGFDGSTRPSIARLVQSDSQTRVKAATEFTWLQARDKQSIRTGDSLFTGENSRAVVAFNAGGQLELGENSLVVFKESDREPLPQIMIGEFNLKVDQAIKVMVGQHVTTIEGQGAEVRLEVRENTRPRIGLLKGRVRLRRKTKPPVTLESGQTAVLDPTNEAQALFVDPAQETENPASSLLRDIAQAQILAQNVPVQEKLGTGLQLSSQETHSYYWRLLDLYQMERGRIKPRQTPPERVSLEVPVQWTTSERASGHMSGRMSGQISGRTFGGTKTYVRLELSREPEFTTPDGFDVQGTEALFSEVFTGVNYWRVVGPHARSDVKDVLFEPSAVKSFMVEPMVHLFEEPWVEQHPDALVLLDASVSLEFEIRLENSTGSMAEEGPKAPQAPLTGVIVQVSRFADFQEARTRTSLIRGPRVRLDFSEPGLYFYRMRIVDAAQELSDWSEARRVLINRPPLLAQPIIERYKGEGLQDEEFGFAWSAVSGADSYLLSIAGGNLARPFEIASRQPRSTWIANEAGEYTAWVTAVDPYGRRGKPSEAVVFRVIPHPVARELASQQISPEDRMMDRIEKKLEPQATIRTDTSSIPRYLSRVSSRSWVGLEGSVWTLESTAQSLNGEPAPLIGSLGVRAQYGWADNTLDGRLRMRAAKLGGKASEASPQSFELRYLRRFPIRLPFQALPRALSASFISGYEIYRNSGPSFSGAYDLFKIGGDLNVPISPRWNMGGEFVYGFGTDSGVKMEFTTYLDYAVNSKWSLGFGGRLSFFEGGSSSSLPGYSTYREGSMDGYSLLRMHY